MYTPSLTQHEETDTDGQLASSVVSGEHVGASGHCEALSEAEKYAHKADTKGSACILALNTLHTLTRKSLGCG